jgi:hypothetical protein
MVGVSKRFTLRKAQRAYYTDILPVLEVPSPEFPEIGSPQFPQFPEDVQTAHRQQKQQNAGWVYLLNICEPCRLLHAFVLTHPGENTGWDWYLRTFPEVSEFAPQFPEIAEGWFLCFRKLRGGLKTLASLARDLMGENRRIISPEIPEFPEFSDGSNIYNLRSCGVFVAAVSGNSGDCGSLI